MKIQPVFKQLHLSYLYLMFRVLSLKFNCNKDDWVNQWFIATTSAVSIYMKHFVLLMSKSKLINMLYATSVLNKFQQKFNIDKIKIIVLHLHKIK